MWTAFPGLGSIARRRRRSKRGDNCTSSRVLSFVARDNAAGLGQCVYVDVHLGGVAALAVGTQSIGGIFLFMGVSTDQSYKTGRLMMRI